jgi:hypothetical protein
MLGMSLATVYRILKESEDETKKSTLARRSIAPEISTFLKSELERNPDVPTSDVLREARGRGYAGGKSAFYECVARLRFLAKGACGSSVGERSRHDYGLIKVEKIGALRLFVSQLKYSGFLCVSALEDFRPESLTRALLHSLESFGGVPLILEWENTRNLVLSFEPSPQWSPCLAQAALDFRCVLEIASSRKRLLHWVRRQFVERAEAERDLFESVQRSNEKAVLFREERGRLRPLPCPISEYGVKVPSWVSEEGWVRFEKIRIPMPRSTWDGAATLHLYPDRIRVVAGSHDVIYPRGQNPEPCRVQDLDARREQLIQLGGIVKEFVTRIVLTRPKTWRQEVEGLWVLFENSDRSRFLNAVEKAFSQRVYAVDHVARLMRESA